MLENDFAVAVVMLIEHDAGMRGANAAATVSAKTLSRVPSFAGAKAYPELRRRPFRLSDHGQVLSPLLQRKPCQEPFHALVTLRKLAARVLTSHSDFTALAQDRFKGFWKD